KIEPGNVGGFQIAPTVQATESNYKRVHGGDKTLYLDPFLDSKSIIFHDSLQTEQGWKFLKKRNRNIVIKVKTKLKEHSLYKWTDINAVLELMLKKNIFNSDSRSVISSFLLNHPQFLKANKKV